jgi:hypothetical protein
MPEASCSCSPFLDGRGPNLEMGLIQSGIGFDGLGHQQAIEDGSSDQKTNKEPHRDRLKRLIEKLKVAPIDDVENWVERSSNAYTLRENQLVFRCWVAERLGVPPRILTDRLRENPMSMPYVLQI